MALFTHAGKLDPGAHGGRANAIHHAVGISCQRNSGYRLSWVKYHGTRSLHSRSFP